MKTWCGAYVLAAWWSVVAAGVCDVTIGGRNYTEETLATSVWMSQGLVIDFETQNLYFSYYSDTYRSARVDIRNKALSVIEELSGPCWYTVDQVRGYVHAGCGTLYSGTGGLHQWDSNTGRFELAGEPRLDVLFVHYHNDTLYYSAYPDLLLHTFTGGNSVCLLAPASIVQGLVVDMQIHYIFTNDTGVYRRWGNGKEVRYAEFDRLVRALAIDGRGSVYACDDMTSRGIWWLHETTRATRLLDVPCGGLTFDGDGNIIYADHRRSTIVRLVQC